MRVNPAWVFSRSPRVFGRSLRTRSLRKRPAARQESSAGARKASYKISPGESSHHWHVGHGKPRSLQTPAVDCTACDRTPEACAARLGGVMRRFEHRVALLFVGVVLCLVLAACEGGYYVAGTVRHSQGEPVAGAKIHVTNRDESPYGDTTASDGDGCFSRQNFTDPMHSSEPLTVGAPGYKAASAKVPTMRKNEVTMTLVPSDSGAESRIQVQSRRLDGENLATCAGSK